jgi:hypothetical protein
LIERADVFLQNLGPGVCASLGLIRRLTRCRRCRRRGPLRVLCAWILSPHLVNIPMPFLRGSPRTLHKDIRTDARPPRKTRTFLAVRSR